MRVLVAGLLGWLKGKKTILGVMVAGLLGWFKGKKTILGGVLVMAGAVAGVWYGKLDPVTGVTILGFGLSIAGWGSKANRHQAELLTALQGISQAGQDSRAGKPIAGDLEAAAGQLMPGIAAEAVRIGGASLNLSAPTTDELLAAVSKLTAAPPPIHFDCKAPLSSGRVVVNNGKVSILPEAQAK